MLQAVQIQRLRGIREGLLEGLSPLVVLVGPNGSGKSTVLEAMFIGASRTPGDAIGQAVKSRCGLKEGAPWLVWRMGDEGVAEVSASSDAGSRIWSLKPQRGGFGRSGIELLADGDGPGRVGFVNEDNSYEVQMNPREFDGLLDVRFVDPAPGAADQKGLARLYSDLLRRGAEVRQRARELVSKLLADVTDLQIGLDEANTPDLQLLYSDHAVPAAAAGDGVQVVLRTAFELAAVRSGLVLLEEPEVHLHPGAMRLSARAVVEAVRSETQVVISTHSLEYIDALLDACDDEDLGKLSVYRLKLGGDGVLAAARLDGTDVRELRDDLADDLR